MVYKQTPQPKLQPLTPSNATVAFVTDAPRAVWITRLESTRVERGATVFQGQMLPCGRNESIRAVGTGRGKGGNRPPPRFQLTLSKPGGPGGKIIPTLMLYAPWIFRPSNGPGGMNL